MENVELLRVTGKNKISRWHVNRVKTHVAHVALTFQGSKLKKI